MPQWLIDGVIKTEFVSIQAGVWLRLAFVWIDIGVLSAYCSADTAPAVCLMNRVAFARRIKKVNGTGSGSRYRANTAGGRLLTDSSVLAGVILFTMIIRKDPVIIKTIRL